jgi:polyphenol oxidase
LKFEIFNKFSGLKYGLSEKSDGSMKIGTDGITDGNRSKFFTSIGPGPVVSTEIVHGNTPAIVSVAQNGRVIGGADGLVTADKNFYLTLTVADCFPVYFLDPAKNIVGLAHAGWRGILSGIISNILKTMTNGLKSNPRDILVAVGPGIQKHHFEIKRDILNKFRRYAEFAERDDKILVNLPGIIRRQILDFGVLNANIEVSDECTFCLSDKYFSFRRGGPQKIEAMAAYIGMTG